MLMYRQGGKHLLVQFNRRKKLAILNLACSFVLLKAAIDTFTYTPPKELPAYHYSSIELSLFLGYWGLSIFAFIGLAVVFWTRRSDRMLLLLSAGGLVGQVVGLGFAFVYSSGGLSIFGQLLREFLTGLPFILLLSLNIYSVQASRLQEDGKAIVLAGEGRGWKVGTGLLLVALVLLWSEPILYATFMTFALVVVGVFAVLIDWRSIWAFQQRVRRMGSGEMPLTYHIIAWVVESAVFGLLWFLIGGSLLVLRDQLWAANVFYPQILSLDAYLSLIGLGLVGGELYILIQRYKSLFGDYQRAEVVEG